MVATAIAGDYHNTATWVGGVVPGNGDQILISHAVTLSDHRVIGASPAATTTPSTWDLDIAPAGKLIITGTGKLTLRGYGRQQTATTGDLVAVDLQDGAIFEFDSTLAPTPATDGYDFYGGTGLWNYKRWQGRGAFIVRSVAGAANGRLRGTATAGQGFLYDFDGGEKQFLLQRLGRSGTLPAVQMGGGTTSSNYKYIVKAGILDATWGIHSGGSYGGGGNFSPQHDVQFYKITTINTPAGLVYDISISSLTTPSGSRIINDCAFEKGYFSQGVGVDATANSFLSGALITGAFHKSWDDNLVVGVGNAPALTVNREYRVAKRTELNAHLYALSTLGLSTSNDHIFEALHTGTDDGEYITTGNGTIGTNTFNKPVFIPQHDGLGLRWVEWNTDTSVKVIINHATGAAQSNSLGFGHSGDNGTATDRGELRNSIVADFTDAGGGRKIGWISNDVAGGVLPENALKNCGYRLAASRYPSSGGVGYSLKQTDPAAVMGAGDVDVDPWPTMSSDIAVRRGQIGRLELWARDVLGLTGTAAEVEDAALRAIHVRHIPTHAEYIVGATISALYSWVRSAWVATNPALRAAGEAGADIGAMGVLSSPAAPKRSGIAISIDIGL